MTAFQLYNYLFSLYRFLYPSRCEFCLDVPKFESRLSCLALSWTFFMTSRFYLSLPHELRKQVFLFLPTHHCIYHYYYWKKPQVKDVLICEFVKSASYNEALRQSQYRLSHSIYLNVRTILNNSCMGWRYELGSRYEYSFRVHRIPLFGQSRHHFTFCSVDWKSGWMVGQCDQMIEFIPEDTIQEQMLVEDGVIPGFSWDSFPGFMLIPWKGMVRDLEGLNHPSNVELNFKTIPAPVEFPADLLYYNQPPWTNEGDE